MAHTTRGEVDVTMHVHKIVFVTVIFLASGCETAAPRYSWGSYQDVVYDMYVRPGAAQPIDQIAKLSADIKRARAQNIPVPPGIHVHLGYMHIVLGQEDAAVNEFVSERELYPESTVFIDGMLQRLHERSN